MMLSSNIDELQILVSAANQWRTLGLGVTPDPVDIRQINVKIHGRSIVLAWDDQAEEWEVTAT